MTPPLVEVHPGWNALTRVAGHMVPCPRCKATFPALDRYWRWAGPDEGGQWLCYRPICMKEDPPPVTVVRPPVADPPKDHIDRVLDDYGVERA
jgi:hypothetical protein